MGDIAQILGLALVAAVNPTLLAAVTVMLLLPSPRRIMVGYLLGAYLTSITVGLLIVSSLEGSAAVSTTRNTISPAGDLVLGLILVAVALVLRSDRSARKRAAREAAKREKGGEKREALPVRLLGRGSARIAFAIGIVLSFPGGSYLIGLSHIDRLDASTGTSAALVVLFCLIQLTLLELPLLGYLFAPEATAAKVSAFRGWLDRSGRRAAANLAGLIGIALLVRGVVFLLT
jgi:hypothetical protein